jgi:hypothetical protein
VSTVCAVRERRAALIKARNAPLHSAFFRRVLLLPREL